MEQLEKFIISKLHLTNKNIGYNIRSGGSTSPLALESKNKLSLSHIGKKASLETRQKLSAANKGEKNSKAILTEDIVLNIRKIRFSCTMTISKAYELFKNKNITYNAFADVWNYRNWKYIGQEYNTNKVFKWHKSRGKVSGQNANSAKLLDIEVENLKLEYICGASINFLSKKYKLTKGNIYKILNRKTYKYVRPDLNKKIKYIKDNPFVLRDVIWNLFKAKISHEEIMDILHVSKKQVINAIYEKKKNNKKEGVKLYGL